MEKEMSLLLSRHQLLMRGVMLLISSALRKFAMFCEKRYWYWGIVEWAHKEAYAMRYRCHEIAVRTGLAEKLPYVFERGDAVSVIDGHFAGECGIVDSYEIFNYQVHILNTTHGAIGTIERGASIPMTGDDIVKYIHGWFQMFDDVEIDRVVAWPDTYLLEAEPNEISRGFEQQCNEMLRCAKFLRLEHVNDRLGVARFKDTRKEKKDGDQN